MRSKVLVSYVFRAYDASAGGVVQSYEVDQCLETKYWLVIDGNRIVKTFANRKDACDWAKEDLAKFVSPRRRS